MKPQIENTGAGAALKWLSDQVAKGEKKLAKLEAELNKAIEDERENPPEKDGADFARIRATARMNYDDEFDAHMKLLSKLQSFDKSVAPEKRDATESITRDDGEKMLMHLIINMRTIAETFLPQVIPQIMEAKSAEIAYSNCANGFRSALYDTIKTSISEERLPSWAAKCVEGIL